MEEISKHKKSIGKNYIFNVIYQVFILIVPLITTPYISRILGVNGVGQYSFTQSLANYFVILAVLGFGNYAQREIAKFQNDKYNQSKTFYEIIIIRFFSVGFSILLNILLNILGVYKTYSTIMFYWIILIAAQELDISFLFQGNEEFGKIILRNLVIKVLSIILIFTFVKQESDVHIYVLCYAGSTFLGNLSLWFKLNKYLCKIKIKELKPMKHLLPTLRLFIPTIAFSVYAVLDKTLIGLIITDTYIEQETQIVDGIKTTIDVVKKYSDLENGYYEQSEKIVKILMTIITSLGIVMVPRNSNEYAKGNIEQVKKNVYFATNFVWFLGVPMTLGLIALAPNIIPWFLGDGYEKCIPLMKLFTPLIIIMGFNNVFGSQYLISTQKDNKYTIAVVSGAVINFILNIILIRFFWSYGAVIATIVAETTITTVMIILIRKEISFIKIIKQVPKYLISGIIMFIAVYFTEKLVSAKIYYSLLLSLEGIVIYFVMLLILKDKFLLNILNKVKLFLSKHKK